VGGWVGGWHRVYVGGPETEWVPAQCKLLPPTATALLAAFPNKRILMMGDSHLRNYFTSMVSFSRCVHAGRRSAALHPRCWKQTGVWKAATFASNKAAARLDLEVPTGWARQPSHGLCGGDTLQPLLRRWKANPYWMDTDSAGSWCAGGRCT
jgi:hypothetical protein